MLTAAPAGAQDDSLPQISVAHPGVDALTKDLMSLTELTSEEEREYGDELKLFIEDISIGADTERPIRVDVLSGSGPLNYLIWIPFLDYDEFLGNLDSIGFPAYAEPDEEDFYLIEEGIDRGWLKMLVEERYAVLAMTTEETHDELRAIVLGAGDPSPAFALLEELKASITAQLTNSEVDEDSQGQRQAAFQQTRDEDMEALQRRPEESSSEFELRKGTADIIYDELQRIYVEASSVRGWSILDRDNAVMSLAFDAAGIPASSFAESIGQFGETPDAFAGIQRLENSVLSGRLNHPVDSLRQKNAVRFIDLLTTDVNSRIDASESLQDSEKQATHQIYDDIAQVFRDGFASGNVNGFVEAIHDGSEFTLVGAVSAPGSDSLVETLRQLPAARAGNEVMFDVAKVGDIAVHKIKLAEGFVELTDRLFGVGREFYVGLGQDQAWMATGPGALELLAAKIGEVGEPAVSDVVIDVDMKLLPWINRLYELAQEREPPEAVDDRAAYRENLLRLQQLSESLPDDDRVILSVTSAEEVVAGTAELHKGLLKFLGVQIAKMSKENLEL